MAKTLSGRLQMLLSWDYQDPQSLSTPKDAQTYRLDIRFGDSATLTASGMWHDRRMVSAASPTDDVDLHGALVDVFGSDVEAQKLKCVVLFNRGENSGDRLLVGGAGSGGDGLADLFGGDADASVAVGPRSPFVLADFVDGFDVVAGSEDVLRISFDGSGGSIWFDLFLFFE